MPLYLCALRDIEQLDYNPFEVHNKSNKNIETENKFTYVKKIEYLRGEVAPEFDKPYFFKDYKFFQITNTHEEFFYWMDELGWHLGFDAYFKSEERPFSKIFAPWGTLFAEDCRKLALQFRDWNALIELASNKYSDFYRKYQAVQSAFAFAKQNGAIWFFKCEAEDLPEYLSHKKKWKYIFN